MPFNIAANQIQAQPVTSYLQGRSLRLAEGKAAQDADALAAQIEMARHGDRRAQESHDTQQKAVDVQLNAEQARTIYDSASKVIENGENAKAYVEKTFPEFIPELEKASGHAWPEASNEEILNLASGMRDHAAVQAHIKPEKPTPLSTEGKVSADVEAGFLSPQQGLAAISKAPSSYDEFMLAQKDPAFKQFLKERKGKGLAVTMPDGTTISLGEVGGVGAAELTGPTKNKLQESIVNATDQLDRLNSIGNRFDPKFLQIPGKLKAAQLKVKDLAGGILGEMTEDEKKYLGEFSSFTADAAKNLSTILNQLSGAAISPAEAERLKKGIPNDTDSPTQFIAKYQAAVKDTSRAVMRANWALKAGIGAKSADQLSKMMPLDSIDDVYADRANEIWEEMGKTQETKAKAVQKANQEFGLAR